MFSAIHEGGHATEQNVDPALMGTAADDCCYMGVHESLVPSHEISWKKRISDSIYNKVQELLPS